jgi:ABC-2 type transport system ATP-binding protein
MHQPKLLLLDEPTSGLDPLMQQEVLGLLREANTNGATVFFSSHIMSEVEAVARRVAIIRAGEIVEVAETASLTQRALNRLTIRFKKIVPISELGNLPGVKLLSQFGQTGVTLQVAGDMEKLVQALGRMPVLDLESEHPSLEDVFLSYYKN